MKVFATKVNGNEVVLIEWTSKKAFERNQSWVDPKFIQVATTSDLEAYEFPYEKGMVVYSPERIAGHNLLHEQFNRG